MDCSYDLTVDSKQLMVGHLLSTDFEEEIEGLWTG